MHKETTVLDIYYLLFIIYKYKIKVINFLIIFFDNFFKTWTNQKNSKDFLIICLNNTHTQFYTHLKS